MTAAGYTVETTSGTTVAGMGALGCDPATHVSENQACVAPTWGVSYPDTTCSRWEVGCVSPSQPFAAAFDDGCASCSLTAP